MKYDDVMKKLESLGTAQNRKVYARHGVKVCFGVSFADMEKLRKSIKTDHALACELWESGNHDARVLATMIADPAAFDDRTLDAWAKSLDNYVIADMFSRAVAGSALAPAKAQKWTKGAAEFTAQSGWNLVAALAVAPDLPDAHFEPYLETIEANIHTAKNRVRHAMNNALIAIGGRSALLEKQAVAAAKRIGVVEVDHGETGCKTPAAIPYIQKMRARATAAKERKK